MALSFLFLNLKSLVLLLFANGCIGCFSTPESPDERSFYLPTDAFPLISTTERTQFEDYYPNSTRDILNETVEEECIVQQRGSDLDDKISTGDQQSEPDGNGADVPAEELEGQYISSLKDVMFLIDPRTHEVTNESYVYYLPLDKCTDRNSTEQIFDLQRLRESLLLLEIVNLNQTCSARKKSLPHIPAPPSTTTVATTTSSSEQVDINDPDSESMRAVFYELASISRRLRYLIENPISLSRNLNDLQELFDDLLDLFGDIGRWIIPSGTTSIYHQMIHDVADFLTMLEEIIAGRQNTARGTASRCTPKAWKH